MLKHITTGIIALSLTLMPAAPVQAQTDRADRNRAAISLLALGALGLAIHNSQNGNVTVRTAPQVRDAHQPHRNDTAHRAHRQRPPALLPGRCFRRVENARGGFQAVYGKDCLDRRYVDAHRLPRQCETRIGGRDGHRRGYDAPCLRDYGYRSDQRWH